MYSDAYCYISENNISASLLMRVCMFKEKKLDAKEKNNVQNLHPVDSSVNSLVAKAKNLM